MNHQRRLGRFDAVYLADLFEEETMQFLAGPDDKIGCDISGAGGLNEIMQPLDFLPQLDKNMGS